jgi:hypothetical protein
LSILRLSDLVHPRPVEDFIQATYGQTWAHLTGPPIRFQDLADWATLNSILSTQRFEAPRFRVANKGDIVPAEKYTEEVSRRGNSPYRRIIVDRLLSALREGSTLSIDRAEQAHGPIRDLAAALESELRAEVSANLFASWKAVPGFELHWDDQDIFVLQLDGKKHWQIYSPTRCWPQYQDAAENPPPEAPPVCELELSAGDVLYLPHGWWHSVSAIGEPSLHLTIGFAPPTGIDLLNWVVGQATSQELFRRRVPRFSSDEQKSDYHAEIRAAITDLLSADDLLDQYLIYSDGTSGRRPIFSFPDIAERNNVLERRNSIIGLIAPRASLSAENDSFILTAIGRRWRFPTVVKPLIDAVLSIEPLTVDQALSAAEGVSDAQAADVIFSLLKTGVITLR